MSAYRGPSIVKDGLIYCIDPGDTNCYPGTGTVCRSLVSAFITGSLINSPTFSTENGGCFIGNGNNNYISIPSFQYNLGTTESISLEVWINPTGPFNQASATARYGGILGQGFIATDVTGYGVYVFGSLPLPVNPTSIRLASQIRSYNGVSSIVLSTQSDFLPVNNWYHLLSVFNRTTGIGLLYINGIEVDSVDISSLSTRTINPTLIGTILRATLTYSFGGRMAVGRIYNRALSYQEVVQNFNSSRGRFGL